MMYTIVYDDLETGYREPLKAYNRIEAMKYAAIIASNRQKHYKPFNYWVLDSSGKIVFSEKFQPMKTL